MSLQSILEEIKKVKPHAEEDTNSGPIETLNTRRGRKSQALESLKRLKRDYQEQLLQNTVFIVATGTQSQEFVRLAKEEFNLFTADSDAFYQDLANRVPEVLYKGKQGVSNVFDVLGRHLEDKMGELDVDAYNQLLFRQAYAQQIDSVEQFKELIKLAVNLQIGAEVVGIHAIASLVDLAIEKNHTDKITPVVLSSQDEQFVLHMMKDLPRLKSRTFLVIAGEASAQLKTVDESTIIEDTTKGAVKAALKKINNSLKK